MYFELSRRLETVEEPRLSDTEVANSYPVLVEIDRPDTGRPTWLQCFDGKTVTTTLLPTAHAESGEFADWGGMDFQGWEPFLQQFHPDEITRELVYHHALHGFHARLHQPPAPRTPAPRQRP